MSDTDREWMRQGMIAAAELAGLIRLQCPDYPRCHFAVTTKDQARADAALNEHLTQDARHTGGTWIDRDGRRRTGLQEP